MILNRRALVLLLVFLSSFCGMYSISDRDCLKSIKDSLQDPFNYLNSSWDFSEKTAGSICNFIGVECWHGDEDRVLLIQLSGMGLKGIFPKGLKECTSLTGLDLSNNQLYGSIPQDIATFLGFVTSLDLSNNDLSGQIPSQLSNLTYLNVLRLDHNRLTGNIPAELGMLQRLKIFSVSNNLLSGPVPQFSENVVTIDSYANNKKLCGEPLEPCQKKQRLLDDNVKIYGFIIGFIGSFILVCTCQCFLSFDQAKKKLLMMIRLFILGKKSNGDHESFNLTQFPSLKIDPRPEILINNISFAELSKATDNFSEDNIIGLGKMGTVYKAPYPNGFYLAVKRLTNIQQFENQFLSEILALGRLRHVNLVPLLGFSIESDHEKLLVYKYMPNGNLYDWLHLHPKQNEPKILEWPLRVKIAIGIARGLAWLHHKCNFQVVHRNLTSKCVLLDRYFQPHISNFEHTIISNNEGAMLVNRDEIDWGHFVETEEWESDYVKKDVYSYGLVLIELITGKKITGCSSSSSFDHNALVEWINSLDLSSSRSCNLSYVVDNALVGQGFEDEILEFFRVGFNCVQPFSYQRPTMLEVYKRISSFGGRYGITCDFGNFVPSIQEADHEEVEL